MHNLVALNDLSVELALTNAGANNILRRCIPSQLVGDTVPGQVRYLHASAAMAVVFAHAARDAGFSAEDSVKIVEAEGHRFENPINKYAAFTDKGACAVLRSEDDIPGFVLNSFGDGAKPSQKRARSIRILDLAALRGVVERATERTAKRLGLDKLPKTMGGWSGEPGAYKPAGRAKKEPAH